MIAFTAEQMVRCFLAGHAAAANSVASVPPPLEGPNGDG